jgi:hypothetical protein
MGAEVDAICNAPYGEASPERLDSRNGLWQSVRMAEVMAEVSAT